MPDFRLTWTLPLQGEDDRVITSIIRATTPERAEARALEAVVHPSEVDGFEFEIVELDDDGEPVE